jgi:diguanylate cyclase (GGDEF)-like protein
MSCSAIELNERCAQLESAWAAYAAVPGFERFVEYAVSLSSVSEFLLAKGLSGIGQFVYGIEQQAQALFGDDIEHPMADEVMSDMGAQIAEFRTRIDALTDAAAQQKSEQETERRSETTEAVAPVAFHNPRHLWLVGNKPNESTDLIAQLAYFGMRVDAYTWQSLPEHTSEPGIVMIDASDLTPADATREIEQLRQRFAISKLLALNLEPGFAAMHDALRAGCDACVVRGTPPPQIIARIIDYDNATDDEAYRVLLVEDSKTASAAIQKILRANGVDTCPIYDPQHVLVELERYQPDLILMDMHMPGCTGIEAARVIRQYPQFLSTPIVYLSAETDIARQIDALRLGGDHFLTKPVNVMVLNAIVKTKIERYRALRRSMSCDSLTGLLNHTSSKQRIDAALTQAQSEGKPMAVAMIDIDHFKKVNDNYGHPMGDQIIRALAWLLKQRLRKTDIVGRYGGEEFIVGLPGAAPDKAFSILDRIRTDFGLIRHPIPGGDFCTTFSSGVAHFPALTTREELVKAADEALYVAKRGGRNQVASA